MGQSLNPVSGGWCQKPTCYEQAATRRGTEILANVVSMGSAGPMDEWPIDCSRSVSTDFQGAAVLQAAKGRWLVENDITLEEHDALAKEWHGVFGEEMPWGFGISPNEVPVLRQCIASQSKEPLST